MGDTVHVAFDGNALELRSAKLDGTAWLNGRGTTMRSRDVFNNRLFHAWLVRVVEKVLPRLEKVVPIAVLSVTIESSVEAWDAVAEPS
jgi:hypothetical protein